MKVSHPHSEMKSDMALNQLANGKSTGVDELPAELWKATGELGIDLLWKLCKLSYMGAAIMAYRLV